MRASLIVAVLTAASLVVVPLLAQVAAPVPVLWLDRGDISVLDLVSGSGGKENAPGIKFTFIKESSAGTSPKFEVEDESGAKWKVKMGDETKAETAATRLLWAAGYFVDDSYFRSQIQVQGLKRLDRGQQFVSGDTVKNVRLEVDRKKDDLKGWDWHENPFVGTREFNGLKVMMALMNLWDLKRVNNGSTDGQYSVTDLGASFGQSGNNFIRTKGDLDDYAATKFIEKVSTTHVDFVIHSRPFLLTIVNFPNYRTRTRMEALMKNIPIADARWIGVNLGQLSARQIRDCFETAGFSAAEVDGYSGVVTKRIAALKAL